MKRVLRSSFIYYIILHSVRSVCADTYCLYLRVIFSIVLVRVKMAMVSMNIMMVSMAVLGAVLYMQVIIYLCTP